MDDIFKYSTKITEIDPHKSKFVRFVELAAIAQKIADSNTKADALATSVFVMGPDAGMKLVESVKDVECLMVDANRNILRSSGIDEFLIKS